jgi:flagellar capping protein FliD
MSALTEKIDASMSALQTKVEEYNKLVVSLEAVKGEVLSLQGALNALKEVQAAESDEATTVKTEVV